MERHKKLPRSIYVPGAFYFVVTSTIERIAYFEDKRLIFSLLKDLSIASAIKDFQIAALAIIPDHIHLIIKIGKFNQSQIMHSFKLNSSKNINKILRPLDEFSWQHRFYDHLIRDDEKFREYFYYTLQNPMKHGTPGFVWSIAPEPDDALTMKGDSGSWNRLFRLVKAAGSKPSSIDQTELGDIIREMYRL